MPFFFFCKKITNAAFIKPKWNWKQAAYKGKDIQHELKLNMHFCVEHGNENYTERSRMSDKVVATAVLCFSQEEN